MGARSKLDLYSESSTSLKIHGSEPCFLSFEPITSSQASDTDDFFY